MADVRHESGDIIFESGDVQWGDGETPAVRQVGYRFRNNDGDQANATFAAVQNAPLTAAPGVMRVRFLLNYTGDPAAITPQFGWRFKPSGGSYGPIRKLV